MLIEAAELAGLAAGIVALLVVAGTGALLPRAARGSMIALLIMLTCNHLANTLEQHGMAWADIAADHLSIVTPLLWGLFLLEISRAHLSSKVEVGEAQLAFFFEKLPVSVAWVRADGSLEAFSAAWQACFPGSRQGQRLDAVLPVPLPKLQAAVARAAADSGEASVREEVAQDPAGQARFYHWALRGFQHPDHALRSVLLILEDRTSEIEAEAKLSAASTELTSLQRIGELGQLAAGAAHDLNNLLQVVSSALWTLENEGPSPVAISAIQAAVETATALTNAMLHFGRAVPGKVGPVELVALLREMQGPLSHVLGRRHELVIRTDGVREVVVQGNPSRLQQALLNLVVNARDAMPSGGPIQILLAADPESALLSVRDTGDGIPEDVRAKLFTPFFTTKGQRGTGLGLGVVRSAVAELHGSVVVESQQGVGTTFRLRIPRQPTAAPDR